MREWVGFRKSVIVSLAGFAIAIGFGVALASGSVFSRFRVYQRWPMGVGDEWDLHQGLIGVVAGVLLSCFASAEIRQRLVDRYQGVNCRTVDAAAEQVGEREPPMTRDLKS